ncbi:hypothetical protein [Pseudactinotalea sp.]|uniref:hypothetical protein n=1 Tax=Pseudactinotalea sp. TaxID=1926260 RepID=UPI003B3A178D
MTTAAQLRKAALSLPEVDSTDAQLPSFSVAGRVFVSLAAGGDRVLLRLPAADVEALLAEQPTAERSTRGASLVGASVTLADIGGQQLNHWVRQAWKHRAPKHLAASAEAAESVEPGDGDLPRAIGRPATRALAQAGITTLDGVSHLSEAELSSLHGVGPKAIRILQEAIAEATPQSGARAGGGSA